MLVLVATGLSVAIANLRGSLPGTFVARGTGLTDFHEISEIGGQDHLLPRRKGGKFCATLAPVIVYMTNHSKKMIVVSSARQDSA